LTNDWKETLRHGGAWPQKQEAGQRAQPQLRAAGLKYFAGPVQQMQKLPDNQARLWLWASVMIHDGRVANRGWLQENPEPVSYIAWGNYADIHPEKARVLGIKSEDVIELTTADNRTVQATARVTNEVGPDTVALALGQGHTGFGMVADNIGANGFALMPAGADFAGPFGTVSIKKTGRKEHLALALGTRDQHRRELLQWRKLSEVKDMKPGPLLLPLSDAYIKDRDLYPGHKHVGHRWAMVIDLQRCVGCQACAVACYAENNLPVTGKHRTRLGRNMPWLRVVPYRDDESPIRVAWLPMLCQHCDSAPCEPVCPVFAAVNNEEGLNAQIYNRCIGTRYCSNNCPYKVRRFNWFDHAWRKPLDWQLNPEVTVRCRGVMEKCTFCVQRIRNAEYRAMVERRELQDGEITPACVQTCPAKVFTFGDLLDPDSEVTRMTLNEPRRYHVLEDLNTKPAVTYLFRIKQET
jgi:molybdopterin-containing oxidoreductase family iron-sulfur binding subunit